MEPDNTLWLRYPPELSQQPFELADGPEGHVCELAVVAIRG